MQHRLLLGFLPSYAREGTAPTAPVCFVPFRAAQVVDDDVEDLVAGLHQRERAQVLATPGEGMSFLFASTPGDVVLVRSYGDEVKDRDLRDRLALLADHLGRCDIAVGAPQLTADPEGSATSYLESRFVCPATFGAGLVRAFKGDPQAQRHRELIRLLDDKLASHRLLEAAGVPVSSLRVLDHEGDVEAFITEVEPPWVLKASQGAGGEQVAIAATAGQVREKWCEIRTQWGQVLGEPYKPGSSDWFVYFVIDPSEAEPRFVMAGQVLTEGGRFRGNTWSRDAEAAFDWGPALAIAREHHRVAIERRVAAFHEGQDFRSGPPLSYLETNPRLGAGTAMTICRARCGISVETMRNVVLPRHNRSLAEVLDGLRPFEATRERGEGVIVYSAGDFPSNHLLAITINDRTGRIESALRRAL